MGGSAGKKNDLSLLYFSNTFNIILYFHAEAAIPFLNSLVSDFWHGCCSIIKYNPYALTSFVFRDTEKENTCKMISV